MLKLYFYDTEKEVANTIEDLREYLSTMGAKELSSLKDASNKDFVLKAVEESNTYYFEFSEEKLKKLVKTIMPSYFKKKKDDEESILDDEI